MGVGAERAAAVRDDLAIGRQLGQAMLELVDRDRARALDVAGLELLGGRTSTSTTSPLPQARDQLVAADRLDVLAEVVACRALDLGELRDGGVAQRQPERSASSPASA